MGLALIVVAGFLGLASSSAFAARGHVFKEAFGTPCTTAICAPGELKEPSAVAVNEATGDVYVLDEGNARIERFSASGTFLGQFDGSETPAGVFEFTEEPQVSGVAVDNSCSLKSLTGAACEAADPSNEDVYVIDPGHEVIDKFRPNGEYLGQITEAASEPFFVLGGVSVDQNGSLWVYQRDGTIAGVFDRFDDAPVNGFVVRLALPIRVTFLAPGFAIDGEGEFYARGTPGASEFQIEKYDDEAQLVSERIGEGNSSGVATDQRSGNVFIDTATRVTAFTPAESKLEELGEEAGQHHLAAGAGLAVDSGAENIYVADRSAGQIVVFEARQPEAPEIVSEGASDINSAAARLEAEINPRSEPGEGPTSYRFQYGPCAGALSSCASSPFGLETPLGSLGGDFEIHSVSSIASGLLPSTFYHYRLLAENELGEAVGLEHTFTTQSAGGALTLPDSRQWQLVSPPDKQGAVIEPIGEHGVVQAASTGQAISYLANAPVEASPQGGAETPQILSSRGDGGWGSQTLTPPHNGFTGVEAAKEYVFFSEDLSLSFLQPFGAFTPSISPEASEQTAFRRTDFPADAPGERCGPSSAPCYRPLVTAAPGVANVAAGIVFGQNAFEGRACPSFATGSICARTEFQDATPDGAHAVLSSKVALSAAPIDGWGLYEWSAEAPPAQQLQLISALPNGQPAKEARLGFENFNTRGAMSDDGSRVVWEAGPVTEHSLYLHDLARGETIQLDAAEGTCLTCESGGGKFQLAAADGSRVLFTDPHALTVNAAGSYEREEGDLYECRVEVDGEGHLACDLTDLTPKIGGEPADVLGSLPGADTEAEWIYFVANGVLTSAPDSEGEQAKAGACSINLEVPVAPGVTCNLYLLHEGQVKLVSVLSGEDTHDWAQVLPHMSARVSANGQWLAFMSQRSLTGYDNRDRATGKTVAEAYLYSAATDRLQCASCDPTGARPRGIEYEKLEPPNGIVGPRQVWRGKELVGASVPGWTGNAEGGFVSRHQPRYLSDSGRVFFNTPNALAPSDSNGTQDVYQYEPPGLGSCTESDPAFAALNGGCVDLITSGASKEESAFLDASESGDDVFFLTSSRLDPSRDVDAARDVYDAHVCTAAVPCLPEPPVPAPACAGDACQQPAVPPNDQTPGSLTFQGAGNVLECPKGQQLKKGKCVKKKAKKHSKKQKKKGKANQRHAKSNRGASK